MMKQKWGTPRFYSSTFNQRHFLTFLNLFPNNEREVMMMANLPQFSQLPTGYFQGMARFVDRTGNNSSLRPEIYNRPDGRVTISELNTGVQDLRSREQSASQAIQQWTATANYYQQFGGQYAQYANSIRQQYLPAWQNYATEIGKFRTAGEVMLQHREKFMNLKQPTFTFTQFPQALGTPMPSFSFARIDEIASKGPVVTGPGIGTDTGSDVLSIGDINATPEPTVTHTFEF